MFNVLKALLSRVFQKTYPGSDKKQAEFTLWKSQCCYCKSCKITSMDHGVVLQDNKSNISQIIGATANITERQLTEKALIQAKVDVEMEIQVYERTADLQKAVEQLEAEIAERRRTEQELSQSKERFRNLVETTSDCVWEMDEKAVYTYVSPKVYEILGYKSVEVIGKTPFDLMPPAEAWRVSSIIGPLAAAQQSFTSIENTNLHKDGHQVVLETNGVPVFDADGQFRGYRGINRDITERKQAEDMLRQQALAFENIYDGIIITDFEGRITAWNSSAERMFGYSKEEVLGKTTAFLHTPEQAAVLTQQILDGINRYDRWTGEIQFIRKNGVEGICETIFVPVYNDSGDRIAAIGVNHDITERKQAEVEIRKALEKEKEVNEMKSRFFSMASHDFRTPLATIIMSSDLLKVYGERFSNEKKIQHLDKIQMSVKKMTQLLDDILFIGIAEAGCIEFNPVRFNLEVFCREVLEEIEFTDNKNHFFTFDCDQEYLLVEMDQKLIQKMLINLLSNAVKYSPQGGTIQLKIRNKNGQTIFQVKDEGIGIPQADQECLFELFQRASNVGDISGTGLGMAIIKQAIDLHGGSISFESEVGVGTTFTICVPTTQG